MKDDRGPVTPAHPWQIYLLGCPGEGLPGGQGLPRRCQVCSSTSLEFHCLQFHFKQNLFGIFAIVKKKKKKTWLLARRAL